MADTFDLEIATPERLLTRVHASEAQIPAANGYLGILPGHSPLLSELGIGEMSYTAAGRTRHLAIDGGWVEVAGDRVRVLATKAENADEIDEARAEAALKRAAERLSHPDIAVDIARALNAMKRAQSRLAARRRLRVGD
jgi:F-type H+-transporting ATPase subunit epsilon